MKLVFKIERSSCWKYEKIEIIDDSLILKDFLKFIDDISDGCEVIIKQYDDCEKCRKIEIYDSWRE